ncbi:MAG: type V CRISPR-associated protein Cas12a/Cpf1, partial [bacterium]|nr:type V CRISPR-associated protein Cas12a/Cpf1 [bacterium]
MASNNFSQFTNLYSLSKTLRFELKPIGKTLENIEKNGLLEKDQHRADSYKVVKKIIDEYHKTFIEKALSGFQLDKDSLSEYLACYRLNNKDETRAGKLKKAQDNLRKQIADQFTNADQYKILFDASLFNSDKKVGRDTGLLSDWIVNNPQIKNKIVEELKIDSDLSPIFKDFESFATYFVGFNENRRNMYSAEEKSTAISHRLINENLPKFVDNIQIFEKVANSTVSDKFINLCSDFKDYLSVESIASLFKLNYYSSLLTQSQIDVYNAIIGGRTEKEGQHKIQGLNEYINLYNQQQNNKDKRLPKLKPLFKQILSDRKSVSWLPEGFKSDNEVLESIEKCYRDLTENVFEDKKERHSLKNLICNLGDYDLNKIYIRNDDQLSEISKQMFDDYSIIRRSIEVNFERDNPKKPKESVEKYEERKQKFVKAEATDKFPAQVEVFDEDVPVGTWNTTYISTALDVTTKKEYIKRVDNLIDAVKKA